MVTEKTTYSKPTMIMFTVVVEKFLAASVQPFSEVDVDELDF